MAAQVAENTVAEIWEASVSPASIKDCDIDTYYKGKKNQ
jgi:predicted transcriptional regulator